MGTVMGWPLAGERMLCEASMSTLASIWASGGERDVQPAIWSPSKSALKAVRRRVVLDLDGFAFDEHRLKRLDAEAADVARRAVEQDGVILEILEDVPDDGSPASKPISGACLMVAQVVEQFEAVIELAGLKSSPPIFPWAGCTGAA